MENLEKKKNQVIEVKNFDDFLFNYIDNGPQREIQENLNKFIEGKDMHKNGFEIKASSENKDLQEKISHFIETFFDKELLERLSITEIVLRTDIVWVRVPSDKDSNRAAYDSYIPYDIFVKKLESLSPSESALLMTYIRRAECHVAYNSLHPALKELKENFNTPIVIYNQEFDVQNSLIKQEKIKEAGLEYLLETEPEKQQETYLLGSIAHEIGHHIFENIILDSDELLHDVISLVDQSENITQYADGFDSSENSYLGYHERFAEVMRLYTTAPEYLKKINIKLFEKIDFFLKKGRF